MQDSFLITTYILSIVVHVVSFVVHTTWVIPLQVKEAKVKNGLRELRVLMLMSGISMMIIGLVSILVLSARFYIPVGSISQAYYTFLILLHSVGFLAFSFIKKRMYHQQYSIKQKEHHAKIQIMEEKEARENK